MISVRLTADDYHSLGCLVTSEICSLKEKLEEYFYQACVEEEVDE